MKSVLYLCIVVVVTSHVALGQTPSREGDFTLDEQLTAADIDMLTRVAVTGDRWFDLNESGEIDSDDRLVWIKGIMGTWNGDANLNGEFGTDDLVQMFQFGKYEREVDATWADGDMDGNGRFDSGDLVMPFVDGGYEVGPGPGPGSGPGPRPPRVATPGTPRWFGDLNLDQLLTAEDIDLLSAAVRERRDTRARALFHERGFDLNGDNQIDHEDRVVWVLIAVIGLQLGKIAGFLTSSKEPTREENRYTAREAVGGR